MSTQQGRMLRQQSGVVEILRLLSYYLVCLVAALLRHLQSIAGTAARTVGGIAGSLVPEEPRMEFANEGRLEVPVAVDAIRARDKVEANQFVPFRQVGQQSDVRWYYAVAVGAQTGIWRSWEAYRDLVIRRPYAVHKKFRTLAEAERFLNDHGILVTADNLHDE